MLRPAPASRCSSRCQGISSNTSSNIDRGSLSHALLPEDAVLLGFLLRGADLLVEFGVHRRVPLVVPFAERDQMRLQPRDRIAERPLPCASLRGAVAGRIVRGRMAFGAIGEELDQRRPAVRARAVGRPARRGIDRERVVAVDPQAGDAIADRARGEGRRARRRRCPRSSRSPTGC